MEETTNPQQAPGAFVDTRPSWDEYFMKLAEEVATRTTCLRRAVGAVVVRIAASLPRAITECPPVFAIAPKRDACANSSVCLQGSVTRSAVDSTPNKMRSCRLRAMASTSKVLRST